MKCFVRQLNQSVVVAGPVVVHTGGAKPLAGMMPFETISIQLIDTPPITADYMDSYLHGLIRAADLTLLMVDLDSDSGIEQCQEVLDRLAQDLRAPEMAARARAVRHS